MFDLSFAKISRLSIHLMDHEGEHKELHTSQHPVVIEDEGLLHLLQEYTFRSFRHFEAYHSFTYSNDDPSLNPLGLMAGHIFDQTEPFHDMSVRIGRHLLQSSSHHKIKSGDLMVVYISDVAYEDEMIDAIGIFKSENKEDFLKLAYANEMYNVSSDRGINVSKLDKGCIIYNTAQSNGYVVASVDKTAVHMDAQYWTDQFLRIKPLDDAFYATQQYMNMAQTYVSHQLSEDINISKGDQLGILNDAGQYFKSNSVYNEADFAQEVLGGDPVVVDSFKRYKEDYAQELQVEMPEQFGISNLAVRRSAKDFKSVLKLDKNFHVYIHGDRKMIEHGTDPDGRKYYKLFYDNES